MTKFRSTHAEISQPGVLWRAETFHAIDPMLAYGETPLEAAMALVDLFVEALEEEGWFARNHTKPAALTLAQLAQQHGAAAASDMLMSQSPTTHTEESST